MDIALRKDLIDIQELIANPPAPKSRFSSSSAGRLECELARSQAHLSQLEQRFGQLYSGAEQLAPRSRFAAQSRAHKVSKEARRNRHHHQAAGPKRGQEDYDGEDCHSAELRQPPSHPAEPLEGPTSRSLSARCNGHGAPPRVRGAEGGRASASPLELAVDVPGTSERHRLVIRGCSGRFSSVHSLGAAVSKSLQTQRPLRTKTIASLCQSGEHQPLPRFGERKQAPASQGGRPLGSAELVRQGEACLPDARDSPNEWADIMARSARFRSDSAGSRSLKLEPLARFSATKSVSPSGSVRSSLSKSRGRLIVRRKRQKSSLLVRRPNLGTCVGKLSLLRSRNMVNKRTSQAATGDQDDNEQEAEEEAEAEERRDADHLERADGRRQEASSAACKPGGAAANGEEAPAKAEQGDEQGARGEQEPAKAIGRRQERLERMRDSDEQRAPNGTQLLATRPLASLSDESQLYAIPKKSKVSGGSLSLSEGLYFRLAADFGMSGANFTLERAD